MASNGDISPLERLRQLDEERKRLLEDAKKEALDKAEQAINDLNALGFNYHLTESGDERPESLAEPSSKGVRKGTRQVNPGKPCSICGFQTRPPHDARRHRSQGGNKRPFTNEELERMGLRRM